MSKGAQSTWGSRPGAAHDAVTGAGFIGAAVCLTIIACAYCYEVVARYFFAAPTEWASALASYALCGMVFLAMPELARRNIHIVINVLLDQMRPRHVQLLRRVVWLTSAATCLVAAWFIADATIVQYQRGIQTITSWPVPKWPLSLCIAYGMFSTSLYFLRQADRGAADGTSMEAVS
jgi:C4-dicarboxylate transporter DctQ subunit